MSRPNTNGVDEAVVVGAGFVAIVDETAEADVDEAGAEIPENTDEGFEPNREVVIEVVAAVLAPNDAAGLPKTKVVVELLTAVAALEAAAAAPNIGMVLFVSVEVEPAACEPNVTAVVLDCSFPKANPDILEAGFENAGAVELG